jgi:hypothetical protein
VGLEGEGRGNLKVLSHNSPVETRGRDVLVLGLFNDAYNCLDYLCGMIGLVNNEV